MVASTRAQIAKQAQTGSQNPAQAVVPAVSTMTSSSDVHESSQSSEVSPESEDPLSDSEALLPAHLMFLPSHFIEPTSSDDGEEWEGIKDDTDIDESSADQHSSSSEEDLPVRARKRGWDPEHDYALVQAMLDHAPYKAKRGQVPAAWNAVKAALASSGLQRSVTVIRERYKQLLEEEKLNSARAARKSGANEEVDMFTKAIAELAQDVEDERLRRSAGGTSKNKADIERRVGAEIRNAAMRGLVSRDNLTNLAAADGATVREKQANRKRPRSPDSAEQDENIGPSNSSTRRGRKRRKQTPFQQLMNRMDEQDAEDRRLLEEAGKKEKELLDGIDRLTNTILLDREAASRNQIGSRDVLAFMGKFLGSSHRPRRYRR